MDREARDVNVCLSHLCEFLLTLNTWQGEKVLLRKLNLQKPSDHIQLLSSPNRQIPVSCSADWEQPLAQVQAQLQLLHPHPQWETGAVLWLALPQLRKVPDCQFPAFCWEKNGKNCLCCGSGRLRSEPEWPCCCRQPEGKTLYNQHLVPWDPLPPHENNIAWVPGGASIGYHPRPSKIEKK